MQPLHGLQHRALAADLRIAVFDDRGTGNGWLLPAGLLREPWPADEPRFALMGRDMVETARWWIPHRGPELYAEKPPVFLWLQAATQAAMQQAMGLY